MVDYSKSTSFWLNRWEVSNLQLNLLLDYYCSLDTAQAMYSALFITTMDSYPSLGGSF